MAKSQTSGGQRQMLTPEQLQELKDAIIAGEPPKSIHERLGVTVANIHYHKAALKKKGALDNGRIKSVVPAGKEKQAATPIGKAAKAKGLHLLLNGVSISIEGAGAVAVGEGYIKIDF